MSSSSSPSPSPPRGASRRSRRPRRSASSSPDVASPSPSPRRSRSRSRSRSRDRKGRDGRAPPRRGRSSSRSPSPPPSSSDEDDGGAQSRSKAKSTKAAGGRHATSALQRASRSSSRSPSASPPRNTDRTTRKPFRERSESSEPHAAAKSKSAAAATSASSPPPASASSPPSRSLSLHPTAVPQVLLTRSAFSLHPGVFRLRFHLRLVQTCADILALKRADLQQMILDLIISECAATSGAGAAAAAAAAGAGKDGLIRKENIEYVHLLRTTEHNRPGAKAKQASLTLFSSSSNGSSLTSLTSDSAATSTVVWTATVVLRCPSESAAQYIVSHIGGLNTNLQGYAVVVYCKLLNSSTSSYDLRREWEHHFFPTLTDTAARSQLAGAFGPNPYQITLAFNGMPAGHRPDTIVIKYLPVTWVDGTLLTRRGRQKHWLSLAAPANPAEGDAPGARASPRVRFCGNHEEDAIPGGSLSASEVDSEDDEEEGSGRAPSWRRLLLIIKRQLELLLKPAAKLASLQMDAINIKRWEYKPIEDARTTVLRKRRNTANPEAAAAAGANTASEITDDMLRYPMSNPFLPESARGPGAEEEEEQKGGGPAEAPMVSHPLEPLCDLYLMLGDYPSVLAAFEYLHNKRLQNALDRTEEEEDADEDEGVSLANDRVSRGRIVDLGVDVDREEFLRFDAIEARRQAQLDEAERVKAAAQLAAHTARKKKEEALRLQRERALRIQEEEEERAEELMRMQREAKQREFDRSRMDADARARFEARAQREALDSIDKSRRAEERQRQAARRQAQRTEEMASRPPAPAAAAASKIDEEEAALLAQLEAIRRRREQAEDAAPPGFVPPVVIDLAAAEWDGVNPGQFTSIALSTLEHWFQQNIERPFPSDSATTELARETRLSLSQVRDWMNHARKTRWKPTADPNAMLDEDGMPGLMSAHDEAAADMARRVAVAQLSSTSTAPVISMKIKQRQKVATDEETGADGFVRVEGAEQLQSATATPGALPASHPSHLQLESLLNESRPSAPTSGVMSADRVAMLHAAEMAAMSSSAAASTTVSTPARAALPDKAAAALAAIAAKAANAKAEPSASPEAAAATTPAASPVAEEPVGKDSTDSKDTKEKKRSRSSSRSPSRKRSSRSKRHRSGSRSKRSRRSRRSRSRSRSRSGSVDPSVFNPFLGFPMPPWFGMPPGMFAGAEAGGMPPPGFPFMPPGMLPPMPGMPPGMPPAMMAAMVPAMTAAQTAERLRQERKNQAEPTQEEAMAELEAEKKLKAREERAAREAEKIAEKLAREMAKQVAKQAEAAQKALAAMAPPVPVPVPEPPCEPTPPSRRDREREREREPKRESFRESPPEPAYEQPREQGRDAAQQHPLYREQPRDPHGRDSRRSKRDSPYEQPPRDMLLPRDQQQQQPSLSHDFAREQQPLSHDFPLSRDFSRDQARQLYEQQQPRQSPQGYDLPYEQTVTYEPPPREREPREVKRRERSSRESRSARDPRDEAAAAAASSYPAALLGNPQFDPHASAYDPYSASLLQATRDSHAASSGSSSRRDRSSRSDTHASGLPPVPLSSGKYVQAPLSSPPSNYAAYPPQSGYPSVYLPGQSSMMPGVYDDRSSGGRERSERHHRDAAPNNMMMEADTGMMDVEAEGRGHRSKRGGKRRSKKSSQQEGAGGFPVDDATRWRGGL